MAFDLSSISRTKRIRAPKIVVAGMGKIGKTTFAASAPDSVGILTEDGSDAVDAQAFPLCQRLADVYSAIGTLLNDTTSKACLLILWTGWSRWYSSMCASKTDGRTSKPQDSGKAIQQQQKNGVTF